MTAMLVAAGVFLAGALVFGGGVFLVRRYTSVSALRPNNETTSHYLSIIVGLYGIFSGFIIASLWEQQRTAEENTLHEASELRTVFRLAAALPEPTRGEIQTAAIDYARTVIDQEWARLLQGDEALNHDHKAKDRIWSSLMRYAPASDRDGILYAQILSHFEVLSEARRSRCFDAQRDLPAYLWMILITGSFLSIFCTFFIGTENLRTQALLTGTSGGLILLMLFVVSDLQNPFQGYWITTPLPFEQALDRMEYAREQDARGGDARP